MKMMITRGYPASGKSTWAARVVADSGGQVVEVNRDAMREALGFPGLGDRDQEAVVTAACDAAITAAASRGRDVVVSNTNIRARTLRSVVALGVRLGFDDIEVVDFIVDHDELLRRDAARGNKVGPDVLRAMFARNPERQWPDGAQIVASERARLAARATVPVDTGGDASLPAAVVVDVDGTLARMRGRSPYDFSRVGEDEINTNIRDIVNLHADAGYRVIVMSGREDVCRRDTERWLTDHGVRFDELHMRAAGDRRADAVVKRQLVADHVEGRWRVHAWFDDRDQVVDMVRAAFPDTPTICLQVAPGDF